MDSLLDAAKKARAQAVAPLSGVTVGAALETADGTIIYGCNVESMIPVLSSCAERTAIFSALAQGHRQFKRLAVIADFANPITPCGACRQFILEFAPDVEIIMGNLKGAETRVASVLELLPGAYRIEDRVK